MADEPNDLDIFDSVISSERSAEPAQTTLETPPQEQVRDEAGRFAAQQTPAPTQTETEAVQPPAATTPEGVPVAAVQDERRKRQEAERRAEELERRLAALEARPATPTPVAQPETPVTIWDDPDAFIKNQLTPVQQAIAEMRDMQMESRAEAVHGAEKLAAAKEAVKAYFGKPEGAAIHQELMAGGNPYDNLVKWHERQQTLATVGNDPQAWLEKQLDNPEFLAKAVERARAGATIPNANSSGNAPLVNLPPSLSRVPSGGNTVAQGEQSDGDMFASVTSTRRK